MSVNTNVLKRFVIYMAILTFVMFTIWGFVRSFMDRPAGDYETEVCDIRLKDKKYDQALEAANKALDKTPNHRGAMMCKALIFISEKSFIITPVVRGRSLPYEISLQTSMVIL